MEAIHILDFLQVFGAFGFGFSVLVYYLYNLTENIKLLKSEHRDEISDLKEELKEERRHHSLYVDKVSDTLILVNQKLLR